MVQSAPGMMNHRIGLSLSFVVASLGLVVFGQGCSAAPEGPESQGSDEALRAGGNTPPPQRGFVYCGDPMALGGGGDEGTFEYGLAHFGCDDKRVTHKGAGDNAWFVTSCTGNGSSGLQCPGGSYAYNVRQWVACWGGRSPMFPQMSYSPYRTCGQPNVPLPPNTVEVFFDPNCSGGTCSLPPNPNQ
jgi:hypothetical protein